MSAGKILVVDDDPQIRRVMRATLSGQHYEVLEARNGEEALERFRAEMPDLVLLDLNMPGMGGLETCRSLRGGSEAPIIILSGDNSLATLNSLPHVGATYFFAKPVIRWPEKDRDFGPVKCGVYFGLTACALV